VVCAGLAMLCYPCTVNSKQWSRSINIFQFKNDTKNAKASPVNI
jgi:hypothetical protein